MKENIAIGVAALALIISVVGWVGDDQSSIGGPTRFPNSDLSASTITSNGAFTSTGAATFSSTVDVAGVASLTAEGNKIGSASSVNYLYIGAGDGCAAVYYAASTTQTIQATSTSFCNS